MFDLLNLSKDYRDLNKRQGYTDYFCNATELAARELGISNHDVVQFNEKVKQLFLSPSCAAFEESTGYVTHAWLRSADFKSTKECSDYRDTMTCFLYAMIGSGDFK